MYSISFRAMGCQMNIWFAPPTLAVASILQDAQWWFEDYEASFSRFSPASKLSALNAWAGRKVTVDAELFAVISLAKQMAEETDGLFNPLILPALINAGYDRDFDEVRIEGAAPQSGQPVSVPSWRAIWLDAASHSVQIPANAALDLGGIAKGWSAEQVANRLSRYGACLVDAGGDLVTRGDLPGQSGWNITVGDPTQQSTGLLRISVKDAAAMTSGVSYRQWMQGGRMRHHLIDPRTGQPAVSDVLTATVIHPRAVIAEAAAKSLILQGSRPGLDWFQARFASDSAALLVLKTGKVLTTPNFHSHHIEGSIQGELTHEA